MKLFKNRTVLGVTCIVISLIICFAVTPLINKSLSQKTTIVRVAHDAKEGDQLTHSIIQEVEVGNYNLPEDVYQKAADVEGMYLTADVCTGDYLFPAKVSDEPAAENLYLYHLNGEKQAIAVTIDKFARGLSGKLEAGDIVRVIAPDYQKMGITVTPTELQYVEVIAVTASSGYDAGQTRQNDEEEEKELPSTITLLVRPEQAKILAELEQEGVIHISLVFRGAENKAAEFLEAQDAMIDEIIAKEIEAQAQETTAVPEGEQEPKSQEEVE